MKKLWNLAAERLVIRYSLHGLGNLAAEKLVIRYSFAWVLTVTWGTCLCEFAVY